MIYSGQAYYFNSNFRDDDGRSPALSGDTPITQVEVTGYSRTALAQLVKVTDAITLSVSGISLAVDLTATGDNISLGSSGGTLVGVTTVAPNTGLNVYSLNPSAISAATSNITIGNSGGTLVGITTSGSAIGLNVYPLVVPIARTVTITSTTVSGTIAAGALEIRFLNTGITGGTVSDQTLPINVELKLQVQRPDTLPSISYNPSGSTFLISTIV